MGEAGGPVWHRRGLGVAAGVAVAVGVGLGVATSFSRGTRSGSAGLIGRFGSVPKLFHRRDGEGESPLRRTARSVWSFLDRSTMFS